MAGFLWLRGTKVEKVLDGHKSNAMKKIMFLAIGLFLISGLSAQEAPLIQLQNKAQKKEQQKAEFAAKYKATVQLVDSMDFVLEADYLGTRWGDKYPVSSQLNFISIDSTHVVIQVGSDRRIGRNGVGGATAEGDISNLKVKKNDKSGSLYLSMTTMTNLGIYDISMTINGNGYAEATLSGFTSQKLVYYGQLVKRENSRIYQGQSGY